MFEQHFGFSQTPFGKDIPISALFTSRAYQELTLKLRYAVERAQVMCLTGDIGAGKSTAIRAVAHQLSPALYRFVYVPNPVMGVRDIYRDLLRELKLDPPWTTSEARRRLRDTFLTLRQEGQTPVLVIDEAHRLQPPVLEELRMLTLCRAHDYAEQVGVIESYTQERRDRGVEVFGIIYGASQCTSWPRFRMPRRYGQCVNSLGSTSPAH